MPPLELKDFFIATTGAAASFIGLLFVAISFVLNEANESERERTTKRILAESSYAALINVFFVSIVALVPGIGLGPVIFAMAWAGIGNSVHFARNRYVNRRNRAVLGLSSAVYLVEAVYGVVLWLRPHDYVLPAWQIMTLFIILFSVGLVRAWELTGIRHGA